MRNGSSPPVCTRMRWRSNSRMFSSAAFMSWPSRTFTEMLPTRLSRPAASPCTRLRNVLMGTMATSSWSEPQEFCPLRSSTPITVMGTLRRRITWSTGS